jgi:hypothetical protein
VTSSALRDNIAPLLCFRMLSGQFGSNPPPTQAENLHYIYIYIYIYIYHGPRYARARLCLKLVVFLIPNALFFEPASFVLEPTGFVTTNGVVQPTSVVLERTGAPTSDVLTPAGNLVGCACG